jgi:hypothetical protein
MKSAPGGMKLGARAKWLRSRRTASLTDWNLQPSGKIRYHDIVIIDIRSCLWLSSSFATWKTT